MIIMFEEMWATLFVIILAFQSLWSYELVSDYMDPCTESDECTDHRFVCIPDENGTGRCVCDRFHKWFGTIHGCVQIYNYHEIINMTFVQNNITEQLHARMVHIFSRHIAAAYFIIGTMVVAFVVVILYCLRIRKQDLELKQIVEKLRRQQNHHMPECIPVRAQV